jgi:hypothetical protein
MLTRYPAREIAKYSLDIKQEKEPENTQYEWRQDPKPRVAPAHVRHHDAYFSRVSARSPLFPCSLFFYDDGAAATVTGLPAMTGRTNSVGQT